MKTYISPIGFDSSQLISMIVKYGIEGGDKIVLLRPEDERDKRGELAVQAIRDLSLQIDSSIDLQIHRVDHRDFEGMVLSLRDLLRNSEGRIIVNLSGGPREIFLAFTIACLCVCDRIYKATNFSDIDRSLKEIELPNIKASLDERFLRILRDVEEHQPTSIMDIAKRLNISESSVSRQVAALADLKAVDVIQKGKMKEVRITITGRLFL